MALDLSSAQAKLARAHSHFYALEDLVLSWVKKKPYFLAHEHNDEFTRHELIFRVREHLDFETVGLMFGDAVHNLRCALDHLIYALVSDLSGGVPANVGELAFPICMSQEGFDSFTLPRKKKPARLSPLVDDARLLAIFKKYQPCLNTTPHTRMLEILSGIDNADKHRALQPAYLQPHEFEAISGPSHVGMGLVPNDGEIKNDSPVMTALFESPNREFKFQDFKFQMVVAVKYEIGSVIEIAPLDGLYRLLDDTVVDVLEDFTNP